MTSPWRDRFEGLDNLDTIKARCERRPAPLELLSHLPPSSAAAMIERVLEEELYIITPNVGRMIQRIVRHCQAACDIRYPDKVTVRDRCYDPDYGSPVVAPLCVAGPAGVGKSALRKAIARLFPTSDCLIELDGHHTGLPMRGFVIETVKPDDRNAGLLVRLGQRIGIDLEHDAAVKDYDNFLRGVLYREGVAGIGLDEFQHATLSTANARITSLILTVTALGVALIYFCNYSLLHRLLKRPQEDKDRLLANVDILLPEPAGSTGWLELVKAAVAALGPNARIEAKASAGLLGNLTGRLPRNLRRLLALGYRLARESGRSVVTIDDVEKAYHSRAFASARADIGEMEKLANGGWEKTKRLDLCCPEEFLDDLPPPPGCSSGEEKFRAMAQHLVDASLTLEEKRGASIARAAAGTKPSPKVVPISGRKPRSAASLLEAHKAYDPKAKKGPPRGTEDRDGKS